jgi:hypothetical protein
MSSAKKPKRGRKKTKANAGFSYKKFMKRMRAAKAPPGSAVQKQNNKLLANKCVNDKLANRL